MSVGGLRAPVRRQGAYAHLITPQLCYGRQVKMCTLCDAHLSETVSAVLLQLQHTLPMCCSVYKGWDQPPKVSPSVK